MPIPKIPTPRQAAVNFAMKCDYYMRRAEEQKALAREMINNVRRMCDRAVQMRKSPSRWR
jgi:hypothetical protein